MPPNPDTLTPNIAALERLLDHNRQARILWVHLGWCNTGRRTVALTRNLLAKHPNLYMSVRVAAGLKQRHVVLPTFAFDKTGKIRPEWIALFEEFPYRFLIGSDEIVKQANNHPSRGSMAATVGLVDQLPDDLRRKIGSENARAIYRVNRSPEQSGCP